MAFQSLKETIYALATAPGQGAIAIIRLSGEKAISIVDQLFSKSLSDKTSHTLHFGNFLDAKGTILDEVVISLYRNPASYTGEDVVEISCHGSSYIQDKIMQALAISGARMADPGEFTLRAFLNGKMDLSQAEAVADLIASDSKSSHEQAISQLRGGFSKEIAHLREELISFASLIELELDFGEEDVEFANREDLRLLIEKILSVIRKLVDSFILGNVIKNGVPVAIVGDPNVGKSTLLNTLLNEERAIVSDIAGTTRDVIEDELNIDGIRFRFIDTAGIRETTDTIESIGIHKTYEKLKEASIILLLVDSSLPNNKIETNAKEIQARLRENQLLVVVANKVDSSGFKGNLANIKHFVAISAKTGEGISELKVLLSSFITNGSANNYNTVVTNNRHFESLTKTQKALEDVLHGLNTGITGDFIAMDIRQALHHLGEITGEISSDDLLKNIFSNFCIGK